MKYIPPYGSSDPDAPYVDRNSSTSTSGSKIPAGFPNWTQREIVDVIEKAGIAPDDELQLASAIQAGKINYAEAGGTANALTATLSPMPAALVAGMGVRLLISAPNTGAVTLNVNGLGAKAVVTQAGSAMLGGELIGIVDFIYDGAKFWASVNQPTASADRTYFVNAATGNDNNNGLSSGSAFATIQKAVNVASGVQWNGYNCTISVADGTYAAVILKNITGAASATLTGNTATPANCVTGQISNNSVSGWLVQGFKPAVTGSGTHNLSCIGGSITIGNMEWPLNNNAGGGNGGAHMAAGAGGAIFVGGAQRIAAGATIAHMYAADGGAIRGSGSPSLNVVAAAGFTAFASVTNGSLNVVYGSITGAANVTTGLRYSAAANGVINTNGAGENYYPGASAGTKATGGQYV